MRQIINFNRKWAFTKMADAIPETMPAKWDIVNLPHSWNAIDGQDGDNDFYRGTCYYAKQFMKASLPEADRYYLEIKGANSSADVYVNGKKLAHHDNGYSTWRVDMTGVLEENNTIAIIVDNADWISDKNYIDFMRDIGVHFNVNNMLQADCYKKRLENGGLTFLEMGYMLMQAFDFVHLNKEFNCKLQIGGSDQWGNILAGVDLSRKIGFSEGKKIDPLFGFVCPLLLKADGEKMGKTATGTLWVSREKTSAFDFFQAWINSFDEDVERSLAFFTRMEMEDIKELCNKDIREAKKLLAFEVTKLVHGEEDQAVDVSVSKKYHSLYPNSELHIIPNSPHCYTKVEYRELVDKYILEFLGL